MNKFVIFASARSGSTSLARVLGECPNVKMAIEPFHPGFSKWNPGERDYSKLIIDSATMDEALDEIFTRYTAIKVLNYQFDEDIYIEMLKRNDIKIIYLKRNNTAQQALSNLVAEQTGEYHKQENQGIYKNLKSVDIKKMEEMVNYLDSMNDSYERFLKKNRNSEYFELTYETLYSDDFSKNKETITKICDFLDILLPPDEAIRKYMTPEVSKINFGNIYKKVPNYLEIEKRFGKLY